MASWKEFMGRNNFYSLQNFPKNPVLDTIERIEVNEKGYKGDGKARFVLDLEKDEHRVTLNLESCKLLAAEYGDDTDDWIGKKVKIIKGTVPFGKTTTPALIVMPNKGGKSR